MNLSILTVADKIHLSPYLIGFLAKGLNPSIHQIGPDPHRNFPDVSLRYPMFEVFSTSDWCGQLLP